MSPRADFDLLDPDHVGIGRELQIVLDADRWEHEAHLGGDGAPQSFNLLGQFRRVATREREQPVAEFQAERVDAQGVGDRRLDWCGSDGQVGDLLGEDGFLPDPRATAGQRCQAKKRQHREPGHQRQRDCGRGGERQRFRAAAELSHQRRVCCAFDATFGDDDAGGGRHEEGWDLRDEAVADRERGERGGGFREWHAVSQQADRQAAEDVDDGDQQPGDRVAAHELGRTVHRAVEAALLLELPPPDACAGFIDHPAREIGVDRHLLARHRIEAEAGGDFGDAPGAFGDDHEVHD